MNKKKNIYKIYMVVKRKSVSRKKRTNSKRKVVSKKRTNSKRKTNLKKKTNSKRKTNLKKRTNSKRKVVSKKKTNSKKKIKGGRVSVPALGYKKKSENYSSGFGFDIPNRPSLIPKDEIRTKLLEEYKNIEIEQKKYEYTIGLIIGPYVNLSGADLYGIKLTGKDLTGADLSNTDLSRAKLSRAKLTNADLTQADLTNAELYWVKSGGIKGEPKFLPKGYKIVKGYLVGPKVNLTGADLSKADLKEANLFDADLRSANLTDADLTSANLTRADLIGTKLPSIKTLPNTINNSSLFKASIDYLYKQFKIGDSLYNLKTIYSKKNKYYAGYFPENKNQIKMKKSDFVKLDIEVYDKVSNSNFKSNRILPICNKNERGKCKSWDNDPESTKSLISRKKEDVKVNLSSFFPTANDYYFFPIKNLKDNQNLTKDGFKYYLPVTFTKELFQTYIELASIVAIKEEPTVNS